MAWTLINSNAVGFADGGSGHVYTLPSGSPAVGDLDILAINSDTVVATPSGFTAATSFVSGQGSYLYYRIATGGESSSVTVTTSGNFDTSLIWQRWQGASALDVAVNAHVDGSSGPTTPAVSTGTLASSNDLVAVFAALHTPGAGTPTGVTWSSGYTAVTQGAQGAVAGLVGYKTGAGTASESPNVSWTGDYFDRYVLVAAFKPATGGPVSGSASLTAAGSVAAASTTRVSAVSAAAGAGTLTAAATVRVSGTATLTGAGVLNAASGSSIAGAAVLAASGALSATGLSVRLGAAPLASSGALTAAGTVRVPGTATLVAAGALTAAGGLRVAGTANLAAAGALVASAATAVTPRPSTGTTSRPGTGITPRPNTGITGYAH